MSHLTIARLKYVDDKKDFIDYVDNLNVKKIKLEEKAKIEQLKIETQREKERLKEEVELKKNIDRDIKSGIDNVFKNYKTKGQQDLEEVDKEYTTEDYENDRKIDTYGIVGLIQAKEALTRQLKLRVALDQPLKLILLEGPVGTGKSSIIIAICEDYQTKYPKRIVYRVITVPDVTHHIATTAIKIETLWEELEGYLAKGLTAVLFIDEADEIFFSRNEQAGDIKTERLNALIRMLNTKTKNVLIILATNRPNKIDKTILSRCGEGIMCPLPDIKELKRIINMHMSFLNEPHKKAILRFIANSPYNYTGRDIYNLSVNYKEILDLKKVESMDSIILDIEILKYLEYLENSKRNLKNDYLED